MDEHNLKQGDCVSLCTTFVHSEEDVKLLKVDRKTNEQGFSKAWLSTPQ